MPSQLDVELSKTLTEKGYLSREALDPVTMKAAESSGGLATFLVKRGMVSEDVILDVLSEKFNLPRLDLKKITLDKAAIDKVPLKFAEYYRFVPIKLEHKKLTIGVSMPLDIRKQDELRTHLGVEISMALAPEEDIMEAVKKSYGLGAGTIGKILETSGAQGGPGEAEESEKVEEIEKLADDASVIKLVNQILMDAFQKRATDIHIEPYRGKVKVRYRIDGVLYNTNVPAEIRQFIMPIVSRIKIMSNLNIIEKRLPQDGRAIVKISGETIDLRISSIPTPSGESIVIRLLPMTRLFSLEKLGLEKSESAIFQGLIEKPHGIILITGPTGSGKSTTLYACLSMINTDERKIITIEDPVEYEMEGVTQIQVVPAIGLDFARGLRSILRHDPDVIMVGEIRDLETAEITARVALTGHLVFSTLHTNDAASGITRLVDIGVEPYLVASSVEAFVAQRLVRTLCPHCKEEDTKQPVQLKEQIARELGLSSAREVKIFKGKGCDQCNSTGCWGRVAIFEILLVDDEIRELIMKRVPAGEVKKIALAKGMRTLRKSGWLKVIQGVTTPEEILEVAPEEMTMENPQSSAGSHELGPGERRIYSRLDMKVNVRYRLVKPDAELAKRYAQPEYLSVTKNVSASGLVFAASEQVPIGSVVELRIEMPDSTAPVECLARVVRVQEVEPDKVYDVAVCYLDLSGADRMKLEKFVKEEIL